MGRGDLARRVVLTALLVTAPAAVHAQPAPPPTATDAGTSATQRVDTTEPTHPTPQDPAPPAPQEPAPPAPRESTGRAIDRIPTVRFGFGAVVGPAREGVDAGFSFDFAMGYLYNVPSDRVGLMLWPELGYAYDGRASGGGNFVSAGGSALLGTSLFAAGVSSRFLAGGTHDELGLGLRTSLLVQFAVATFTLEAGHQWVTSDSEQRHEFRVTLSVNPVNLLMAVLVLEMFRDIFHSRSR